MTDEYERAAARVRNAAGAAGWKPAYNNDRPCLMTTLPNGHTLRAERYDEGHAPEWGQHIDIGQYDTDGDFYDGDADLGDTEDQHAWSLHYRAGTYVIGPHRGIVPQPVLDLVTALNRSRA